MNDRPGSILLINIRLIGDVILTTPLIAQLADAFPGVCIDVLVNAGTGDFLVEDDRVRSVIRVSNKEFRKSKSSGEAGADCHYLRRILRKYDWAINMNASDRGNFAAMAGGRGLRLGFSDRPASWKSMWRRLGLTHHLPFPKTGHIAERCQVVAEAIGLGQSHPVASVRFSAQTGRRVDEALRSAGVNGPYFVVHPFARWAYKLWHAERFAEVSDWVAGNYGMCPVWTSSPDPEECAMLDRAVGTAKVAPVVFRGSLSLNGISALLAGADFYLGLDTAVTHIAASHAVPLVALYGPTLLDRWHPWSNSGGSVVIPEADGRPFVQYGGAAIVRSQWPCVPCGFASCDDKGGPSPCIKEISVDAVRSAVQHCLAGRPDGSFREGT